MKKNSADNYESIEVRLSEDKTPIAFAAKLKELMDQKAFDDEEKAKKWIRETPLEMELYYSIDNGLFMVEAEAVEGGDIVNPYTGEKLEESDED